MHIRPRRLTPAVVRGALRPREEPFPFELNEDPVPRHLPEPPRPRPFLREPRQARRQVQQTSATTWALAARCSLSIVRTS